MTLKGKMLIALPILLVLGAFIYLSVRHFYGGIQLECSIYEPVSDGIVLYRQDDEDWAEETIGDSKYTLESSGCVITCIATAISETECAKTPSELASYLAGRGVFDSEGNLNWARVDELHGFHSQVFDTVSEDIIDTCLSQGHYPIVRVKMENILSSYHYILIVGAEGHEYICMDPLKDELTSLKDYHDKAYLARCVWYE